MNAKGWQVFLDNVYPDKIYFSIDEQLEAAERHCPPAAAYLVRKDAETRSTSELAGVFALSSKRETKHERLERIRSSLDAYWKKRFPGKEVA